MGHPLGGVGQLEVDHQADVADVESAGGDVGRHQDVRPLVAEGLHRLVAGALGEVSLQLDRVMAESLEVAVELLDPVLGAPEDDRGSLVAAEQAVQDLQLVPAVDPEQTVLEESRLRPGDLDPDRLLEVPGDHPADPLRHRRRGQHCLGLVGHRQDLLDVRREARVEHLVGLVEDQVLDPAQRDQLAPDHVEDPAGGADDDVGSLLQVVGLGGVADAAVEQRRAEPGGEGLPDRVDLDRQLPGRGDDQDAGPGAGRREQALGGGNQEGERLARPGRGLHDDVVAVEEGWDGLSLYLDGRGDVGARERSQDARLEAQLGKRGQGGLLLVPPLASNSLP